MPTHVIASNSKNHAPVSYVTLGLSKQPQRLQLSFLLASYMVSLLGPKPFGIKQESTNSDVAASELSYLLRSFILLI